MALSGDFSGSIVSGHYTVKGVWSAAQSISGNYTDITLTGYLITDYRLSVGSRSDASTTINGSQETFTAPAISKTSSGSESSYTLISSRKVRVYHNDKGEAKNIGLSIYYPIRATINGTYYSDITASVEVDLDTIPRYLSINTFAIQSKTVNSVVVKWETSDARDYTQYSLNGGSWTDAGDTVASNNKSGNFTISKLSPNTTYTIKIRLKRTDSQLWTESTTISVTTYQIATLNSTPDVNIGSSHTVTWANPSGTTISLALYKTDGTTLVYNVGTVTGTSKSITPTASEIYKLIPNANSIKLRYILKTTANGITYTNYKDCTFYVTNSNPTFSNFTYEDVDSKTLALTGNNQIIIKGYSNVKGIISVANKAVGKNSATISKYKLVIGESQKEETYSDNTDVGITIENASNNVFNMYAIDSRGNSTLKTISPSTYKTYNDITIKSAIAERQENGIGSNVTLSFNGDIWNNSFGKEKNEITSCIYKYKKTNSNTWITGETDIMPIISGQSYSNEISIKGDLGAEGFDIRNSYNLQIIISDKLSTYTYNLLIGTGTPGIAITPQGIAFFNMYDESIGGAVQITGDLYVNGKKLNS